MMSSQDPAELLQDVTQEAARLLGSCGRRDPPPRPGVGRRPLGPRRGHRRRDARRAAGARRGGRRRACRRSGSGGSSHRRLRRRRALPRRRPARRLLLREAGIRSIAFAPLIGEATVLGTLAVFARGAGPVRRGSRRRPLAALADLAAIAIHNAELIRELGRSREETARRAETERTLREIAARVTSIRDPEAILGPDRRRGAPRAGLGRRAPDPDVRGSRSFLRPVVVVGGSDEETPRLAAEPGVPDRRRHQRPRRRPGPGRLDARTTRTTRGSRASEDDLDVAERLGWARWPRRRCAPPAAR